MVHLLLHIAAFYSARGRVNLGLPDEVCVNVIGLTKEDGALRSSTPRRRNLVRRGRGSVSRTSYNSSGAVDNFTPSEMARASKRVIKFANSHLGQFHFLPSIDRAGN